ncbi:hypothetical protein N781_15300 [Pontibacillus halophilus JSM 076056 = DSM 19796]|uniref:Uncharacterized protein n=1 Tax=Pontibacillus halophilus JSM 076056 = DSM 19796 TaxID=1385510 RepID=A0A0A5GNG3_9BACI|nr:hypothetical protein [Pontibacillus halophilus]KGX92793.1 hypothetical protein N781_15300 [Pontibacillus halophilus JSM 076056 = DSM 19796]
MSRLVIGCYHALGYELIHRWLEEGEEIVGVPLALNAQKEFLSYFFGRNAHFQEVSIQHVSEDVDIVVVNDLDEQTPNLDIIEQIEANQYVLLTNEDKEREGWTIVTLPSLYGAWVYGVEPDQHSWDLEEVADRLMEFFEKGSIPTFHEETRRIEPSDGIRKWKAHQQRYPTYYEF